MTQDDVLFGYRLQLFAEAARTSVSAACRTFGVHRSTYYRWKRQVDRHGLELLRPRERRRPQMPNQLPKMIEERIVSFSLAHHGLGPKRVASELGREKWGTIVVSPNGVWKVLCRHGLNTRAKRLGLIAGYAAPDQPPRDPGPEQHIDVDRPGELVGIDSFYVGRLKGTNGASGSSRRSTSPPRLRGPIWSSAPTTTRPPRRPASSRVASPQTSKPPAGAWSA
jgi:transposase